MTAGSSGRLEAELIVWWLSAQCYCFNAIQVSYNVQYSAMLHLLFYVVKWQLTTCFKSFVAHPNWPMNAHVFEHLPAWLASWRPIWSDMAPVNTTTQCREDWSLASVVSHSIVTDPIIWQSGFDLPHHTWSLHNHFQTGQGQCHGNLHQSGLVQSPSCDCGQRQTMNHTVNMCPLTVLQGWLKLHHEANDDTVIWLESTVSTALARWNELLCLQWWARLTSV